MIVVAKCMFIPSLDAFVHLGVFQEAEGLILIVRLLLVCCVLLALVAIIPPAPRLGSACARVALVEKEMFICVAKFAIAIDELI